MKDGELLDALAFCVLTAAAACAGWLLVPRIGIPFILLGAIAIAHGVLSAAYLVARRPAPLPLSEHSVDTTTHHPV